MHGVGTVVFTVSAQFGVPVINNMGLEQGHYKPCALYIVTTRNSCVALQEATFILAGIGARLWCAYPATGTKSAHAGSPCGGIGAVPLNAPRQPRTDCPSTKSKREARPTLGFIFMCCGSTNSGESA